MNDEKHHAAEEDELASADSVQDKPELTTPKELSTASNEEPSEEAPGKSVAEMAKAFLADDEEEPTINVQDTEETEVVQEADHPIEAIEEIESSAIEEEEVEEIEEVTNEELPDDSTEEDGLSSNEQRESLDDKPEPLANDESTAPKNDISDQEESSDQIIEEEVVVTNETEVQEEVQSDEEVSESDDLQDASPESLEVEPVDVTPEETPELNDEEVDKSTDTPETVEDNNSPESTDKEKEASETVDEPSEKDKALDEAHQIEQMDFSQMGKEELLAVIKDIANKYCLIIQGKTLGAIKDAFDVFANSEKDEALKHFVETGGDKEDFRFKGDEITSKFFEYNNLIRNNRHQHFKQQEKEKDNNLKLKNALLEKLRETVDNEESTASMNALKEIQTEWRSIGPVPNQHNKTLWANYHALIDRFYDHRSIYFELKELDRKKNLEAKLEICQKAEELDELENFKDAIQKLNELHDEFKHIGPIPKDVQDEVWDRFKTASDLIYSKRKEFVSHIKEQQKENLTKKLELAETITEFTGFSSDMIKEWNAKTKELLELQKKWETIGAMPRENAKDINKKFWSGFKLFFHNKSEFFKSLESQRESNLKQKQELVDQAVALKASTDWHKTAEELKGLQQKWREIGPVPEKFRNSIYKSFKEACDDFFNQRRQHNKGLDSEYAENLKKKEDIIVKMEAIASSGKIDMDEVYGLQDEFNAIGFVPRKSIRDIQKRYQNTLDKLVNNAKNLDDESKNEFKSLINIHDLKSGPNADQKLNRKEHGLRRKITSLESDISTWKNNLGFFASSKNADELLKDFETKIESAEQELASLKEELKLVMKA